MNVLIIGASGMLGNAMFRTFAADARFSVTGTVRNISSRRWFEESLQERILPGVEVEQADSLAAAFRAVKPALVINCVGVVKQLAAADDPLITLPINALLPHRLAALCDIAGARLVQISTDCVFSGAKGGYVESDFPDADDLYGRSKLLGEVDYPHAITLRTSIIGHELGGARSLVNWFLAQQGPVKGFTKAIFSGLPTVVLAELVRDVIVARPELHGLYHVAAAPIAKYDLLQLVAEVYGKQIDIVPSDALVIDRSLDAGRFHAATGYTAPAWPALIARMRQFH
jgi:dTDP-4-dehydrorhamnose reductase